jgi:RNA polymerase sigma factor (sigma-70 family)
MLTPEQSRLVIENLGLANSLAKQYLKPENKIELEDILQLAYEGLIYAAKKYNPKLAKFSTYAYWGMKSYINKGICKYKDIPCSVGVYADITTIFLFSAEVYKKSGSFPKDEEIVKNSNRKISLDRVNLAREYLNLSGKPILNLEEHKRYKGYIEESLGSKENPQTLLLEKREKEELHEAIEKLELVDQILIKEKYFGGKTLNKIATILKKQKLTETILSPEGIRLRQNKAMKNLKKVLLNERKS